MRKIWSTFWSIFEENVRMCLHSYRSFSQFLFIPVDVAKICKIVHVIRFFMDEPIVCAKQKLSRTSWQHIRLVFFNGLVSKTLHAVKCTRSFMAVQLCSRNLIFLCSSDIVPLHTEISVLIWFMSLVYIFWV